MKIKDIFSGYEIIRAYRAEKQMEELHHDSSVLLENSKARTADTMACLYALANMASIAVQFLIMSLAGIFAVRGSITIGSIIAVTQLTGQVISPAFQLSAKISQLKGIRPVCEQMEANLLPADAGELKADLPEMERTLTLEDVSFAYDNAVVIDHVSLQFERGRKYAVVGRSGSGKSTLLKLLAGYDDSYAGSATYAKLENKVNEIFGTKYFLPAHQGRACENILAMTFVKAGDVVPMNFHFTTPKAHITRLGGRVEELLIDEGLNLTSAHPFKGNFDLNKLEKCLKENNGKIPFVRMEAGTNLIGGQPF